MAKENQIKVIENRMMVDLGIELEVDGKKHRLVKFDKFMSCYDCSVFNNCIPKSDLCYTCGQIGASKVFIPKEVMNDTVNLINYLKTLRSWNLSQK